MRWEYAIVWDGFKPMMDGTPERQSSIGFASYEYAKSALDNLPSAKKYPERNYRIERRQVTEWEVVEK